MLYRSLFILSIVNYLIFISQNCFAENWHGSISSTLQTDNSLSLDSKVLAEALLNYVYDDEENDLHSRLNVLIQQSDYDFHRGSAVYELSVEKGFSEYKSRIKAGRFERSDHLGLYFLDGLNLTYQNRENDPGLQVYMGRPGRIDHVQSIEGDYLFGIELFGQKKNTLDKAFFLLFADSWNYRIGLQKLKNLTTAHRINLAVDTQGKKIEPIRESHCRFNCQRFKSQFLLSYHVEKNKLEDMFIDVRVPISQDFRLRLSHEYYHPEVESYPGFREQLYSFYAFGEQKLSQIDIDYYIDKKTSVFVKKMFSNRETGDKGSGLAGGVTIRQAFASDMDLSFSIDTIELGETKLNSFYINSKQHFNSRTNIQIDAIYREEEKNLLGNNHVFAVNAKINYMLKSNLICSFEARKINNSRLRDEHMLRLNISYYFDNFKPMRIAKDNMQST